MIGGLRLTAAPDGSACPQGKKDVMAAASAPEVPRVIATRCHVEAFLAPREEAFIRAQLGSSARRRRSAAGAASIPFASGPVPDRGRRGDVRPASRASVRVRTCSAAAISASVSDDDGASK